MKKSSSVLLAAVLFLATAAPSARAAVEVSGDAYIGVYNMYLWRGFDLSGSEAVVQGGVDLSAKGFTLSYWTNLQASDDDAEGFDAGEATETDITLNYGFDLNDLVSVKAGNIFYHLDGLKDTNELYLGVALKTLLSPALTVYYDYDEAEEDGLFYALSFGHTVKPLDKLGVNLGALVSYNQESDFSVGDYSDWHNYELSVSADYALAEQLTVKPLLLYSSPISDEAKDRLDSEWLAGLNVIFTF
jgi:uncharacterized protein (TIGR02001 family)